MAASLDGFIARKDGRVDWLETSDEFASGDPLEPGSVEAFLETIDCYVMGSRTYETALNFERQGLGWSYGTKPTFVLTDLLHEFYGKKAARFVTWLGLGMALFTFAVISPMGPWIVRRPAIMQSFIAASFAAPP